MTQNKLAFRLSNFKPAITNMKKWITMISIFSSVFMNSMDSECDTLMEVCESFIQGQEKNSPLTIMSSSTWVNSIIGFLFGKIFSILEMITRAVRISDK